MLVEGRTPALHQAHDLLSKSGASVETTNYQKIFVFYQPLVSTPHLWWVQVYGGPLRGTAYSTNELLLKQSVMCLSSYRKVFLERLLLIVPPPPSCEGCRFAAFAKDRG
jgi:hypothetical protein